MTRIVLMIVLASCFQTIFGQTFGNAIEFDGFDDFMVVPHHESLNPGTDSWTIALWIKPPDMVQDGPLVRKRLAGEGYNQFNLLIGHTDPHNPSPGKRLIYNYIDDAGVSERSGHLQDEFVDGNWHHIAVVADNSTDSVYIYIDGSKHVFNIQYNFGEWPNVGNLDSLLIGRDTGGSDLYTGEMDELSLWNKALSKQQINKLISDTLQLDYYSTPDSGLVAYYRFDLYEDLGVSGEGADDFRDFSAFGNHGDTEGNPVLIPSDISVGISQSKFSKGFDIYPNPTSEMLYITSDFVIKKYHIYNCSGQLINMNYCLSKQHQVDVSGVRPGLYIIHLITKNKVLKRKFIIQN